MKHLPFLALFFLIGFLFLPVYVRAEEFALTHIGGLATQGKQYNKWYYEPVRPTFKGTASRGANVDITIDGAFNTVKADTQTGQWSYTPSADMEKKEHTVIVASGSQSYAFTLTVGVSSPPAQSTEEKKNELPKTGFLIPSLLILVAGGFLVYYGIREKIV